MPCVCPTASPVLACGLPPQGEARWGRGPAVPARDLQIQGRRPRTFLRERACVPDRPGSTAGPLSAMRARSRPVTEAGLSLRLRLPTSLRFLFAWVIHLKYFFKVLLFLRGQ